MTPGTGIHLNCTGPGSPNALSVKGGFLIALDDADGACGAQLSNGAFQREVLPDPGELIRFSAVMPRWANQSRLCWARWSFLARIASPMIRFSVIATWTCVASVECALC